MKDSIGTSDTFSFTLTKGAPKKMRKIIAVAGQPGTGKTTLFREFMKNYTWEKQEPLKMLPVMYCKDLDLYVLGKYEEGELFAGTDRLSMAVQPIAQEFVQNCKSNILFEGDRLTNFKFYDFLLTQDAKVEFIVLTVSDETMKQRYKDRGSDQSDTFLKGRETKIGNILNNFEYMDVTTVYKNETHDDQRVILDHIVGVLS